MLNAAETAGVAESDSSAGSSRRSLLSDGGSRAAVDLETRSIRGEARRDDSQGWKIAVANPPRTGSPTGCSGRAQMARWLGLALRLSPEVLGLFHFYRRDGHLLRACEVIALTAA